MYLSWMKSWDTISGRCPVAEGKTDEKMSLRIVFNFTDTCANTLSSNGLSHKLNGGNPN